MSKKRKGLSDALPRRQERSGAGTREARAAATGADEEETSRLNANVPAPLYEAFKERCEREGRSMTWVLTRFLERYARGDE